jgi:hypothetical protein
MIGHARRHVFTETQLYLLAQATRMVQAMPDEVNGEEVRCHEVARAVGHVLGLDVVDGKYGAVDHSWCVHSPPTRDVLDPYTIGRVPQVQLVCGSALLPEFASYRAGEVRADIREHVVAILVECGLKALMNPYARGVDA